MNAEQEFDEQKVSQMEEETAQDPMVEAFPLAMLILSTTTLCLFCWIAERMISEQTLAFDMQWREWAHSLQSDPLTWLMQSLSFIGGNGLVVIMALTAYRMWRKGWGQTLRRMTTTLSGALVLDLALKFGFHRPRPVPFIGPVPPTYSFPSGHALFSLCFFGMLAGVLAGRLRRWRMRALVWAVAAMLVFGVGFSRIYLGVHYPSDVIAGYLAATMWVSAMVVFDRMRLRRSQLRQLSNEPELELE